MCDGCASARMLLIAVRDHLSTDSSLWKACQEWLSINRGAAQQVAEADADPFDRCPKCGSVVKNGVCLAVFCPGAA